MIKINGSYNNKVTEPGQLINQINQTVKIQGSIYKIRLMSGFAFVILRTRQSLVQCIYSEDFSLFPLELLKEEACVIVTGEVAAEEHSRTGYELKLIQVEILSDPSKNYRSSSIAKRLMQHWKLCLTSGRLHFETKRNGLSLKFRKASAEVSVNS